MTDRDPVAAPDATDTDNTADVAVTDTTDADTPDSDTDTVIPAWNPEPDTVTGTDTAPWPNLDGDNDTATGLADTVTAPDSTDTPPSGFTNVRSRAPNAAPDTTDTDTVAESADTDDTVPDTPVPENDTDNPSWNPEPDNVTGTDTAP